MIRNSFFFFLLAGRRAFHNVCVVFLWGQNEVLNSFSTEVNEPEREFYLETSVVDVRYPVLVNDSIYIFSYKVFFFFRLPWLGKPPAVCNYRNTVCLGSVAGGRVGGLGPAVSVL